jgi:hypothetical protein
VLEPNPPPGRGIDDAAARADAAGGDDEVIVSPEINGIRTTTRAPRWPRKRTSAFWPGPWSQPRGATTLPTTGVYRVRIDPAGGRDGCRPGPRPARRLRRACPVRPGYLTTVGQPVSPLALSPWSPGGKPLGALLNAVGR